VQDGNSLNLLSASSLSSVHAAYLSGLDTNGNNVSRLWDSLHSEPVVFHYTRTGTPVSRLFSANNGGFLHAFDADTGEEKWAVMPLPLASSPRINDLMAQPSASKVYGLDGGISVWHHDIDGDNQVDSGESVMVYATARRGGRLITAIDASDPDSPQGQWVITNSTSSDFNRLGETWAEPVLSKLEDGTSGDRRTVLLVAGGYDPQYDDPNFTGTAAQSHDIFIIDAVSGNKLWSLSDEGQVALQKHSFASAVRPYDIDADGTLDVFYALNVRGEVIRCDVGDLPAGSSIGTVPNSSEITCGSVVALSTDQNRRFYSDLDTVVTTKYGPPRFARTHFGFGRKQLQSYIRLLDEIGLSSPDGIRALSSLSTHRFYIKNPCCYQVFKSAGLPFMPSLLFALRNWWCLLL
jgi:type IV pilus assembly protein PilY1